VLNLKIIIGSTREGRAADRVVPSSGLPHALIRMNARATAAR
jgi:hypothetical protein